MSKAGNPKTNNPTIWGKFSLIYFFKKILTIYFDFLRLLAKKEIVPFAS